MDFQPGRGEDESAKRPREASLPLMGESSGNGISGGRGDMWEHMVQKRGNSWNYVSNAHSCPFFLASGRRGSVARCCLVVKSTLSLPHHMLLQ